jgi:hypothetical protein
MKRRSSAKATKSRRAHAAHLEAADAYLNLDVAEELASQTKNATVHRIDAGYWPQIDSPQQVADFMLETC